VVRAHSRKMVSVHTVKVFLRFSRHLMTAFGVLPLGLKSLLRRIAPTASLAKRESTLIRLSKCSRSDKAMKPKCCQVQRRLAHFPRISYIRFAHLCEDTPFTMSSFLFSFLFLLAMSYTESQVPAVILKDHNNVFRGALDYDICFLYNQAGIQPISPLLPACQSPVVGWWIGVPGAPDLQAVRQAFNRSVIQCMEKGEELSFGLFSKINAFICITADPEDGKCSSPPLFFCILTPFPLSPL